MSRTKKSRKPGVGSSGALKETSKTVVTPPEKRSKKKKGKQAGNRQKEAQQQTKVQQTPVNKDSRLGNKTPIELGAVASQKPVNKAKQSKQTKQSTIAAIRTVEPSTVNPLQDELAAIEEDERLQVILAKQDDEIALSEEEVSYFNDKMNRHQEIRTALGLDDENDDEEQKQGGFSEEELWDKFDNSDLSEFE